MRVRLSFQASAGGLPLTSTPVSGVGMYTNLCHSVTMESRYMYGVSGLYTLPIQCWFWIPPHNISTIFEFKKLILQTFFPSEFFPPFSPHLAETPALAHLPMIVEGSHTTPIIHPKISHISSTQINNNTLAQRRFSSSYNLPSHRQIVNTTHKRDSQTTNTNQSSTYPLFTSPGVSASPQRSPYSLQLLIQDFELPDHQPIQLIQENDHITVIVKTHVHTETAIPKAHDTILSHNNQFNSSSHLHTSSRDYGDEDPNQYTANLLSTTASPAPPHSTHCNIHTQNTPINSISSHTPGIDQHLHSSTHLSTDQHNLHLSSTPIHIYTPSATPHTLHTSNINHNKPQRHSLHIPRLSVDSELNDETQQSLQNQIISFLPTSKIKGKSYQMPNNDMHTPSPSLSSLSSSILKEHYVDTLDASPKHNVYIPHNWTELNNNTQPVPYPPHDSLENLHTKTQNDSQITCMNSLGIEEKGMGENSNILVNNDNVIHNEIDINVQASSSETLNNNNKKKKKKNKNKLKKQHNPNHIDIIHNTNLITHELKPCKSKSINKHKYSSTLLAAATIGKNKSFVKHQADSKNSSNQNSLVSKDRLNNLILQQNLHTPNILSTTFKKDPSSSLQQFYGSLNPSHTHSNDANFLHMAGSVNDVTLNTMCHELSCDCISLPPESDVSNITLSNRLPVQNNDVCINSENKVKKINSLDNTNLISEDIHDFPLTENGLNNVNSDVIKEQLYISSVPYNTSSEDLRIPPHLNENINQLSILDTSQTTSHLTSTNVSSFPSEISDVISHKNLIQHEFDNNNSSVLTQENSFIPSIPNLKSSQSFSSDNLNTLSNIPILPILHTYSASISHFSSSTSDLPFSPITSSASSNKPSNLIPNSLYTPSTSLLNTSSASINLSSSSLISEQLTVSQSSPYMNNSAFLQDTSSTSPLLSNASHNVITEYPPLEILSHSMLVSQPISITSTSTSLDVSPALLINTLSLHDSLYSQSQTSSSSSYTLSSSYTSSSSDTSSTSYSNPSDALHISHTSSDTSLKDLNLPTTNSYNLSTSIDTSLNLSSSSFNNFSKTLSSNSSLFDFQSVSNNNTLEGKKVPIDKALKNPLITIPTILDSFQKIHGNLITFIQSLKPGVWLRFNVFYMEKGLPYLSDNLIGKFESYCSERQTVKLQQVLPNNQRLKSRIYSIHDLAQVAYWNPHESISLSTSTSVDTFPTKGIEINNTTSNSDHIPLSAQKYSSTETSSSVITSSSQTTPSIINTPISICNSVSKKSFMHTPPSLNTNLSSQTSPFVATEIFVSTPSSINNSKLGNLISSVNTPSPTQTLYSLCTSSAVNTSSSFNTPSSFHTPNSLPTTFHTPSSVHSTTPEDTAASSFNYQYSSPITSEAHIISSESLSSYKSIGKEISSRTDKTNIINTNENAKNSREGESLSARSSIDTLGEVKKNLKKKKSTNSEGSKTRADFSIRKDVNLDEVDNCLNEFSCEEDKPKDNNNIEKQYIDEGEHSEGNSNLNSKRKVEDDGNFINILGGKGYNTNKKTKDVRADGDECCTAIDTTNTNTVCSNKSLFNSMNIISDNWRNEQILEMNKTKNSENRILISNGDINDNTDELNKTPHPITSLDNNNNILNEGNKNNNSDTPSKGKIELNTSIQKSLEKGELTNQSFLNTREDVIFKFPSPYSNKENYISNKINENDIFSDVFANSSTLESMNINMNEASIPTSPLIYMINLHSKWLSSKPYILPFLEKASLFTMEAHLVSTVTKNLLKDNSENVTQNTTTELAKAPTFSDTSCIAALQNSPENITNYHWLEIDHTILGHLSFKLEEYTETSDNLTILQVLRTYGIPPPQKIPAVADSCSSQKSKKSKTKVSHNSSVYVDNTSLNMGGKSSPKDGIQNKNKNRDLHGTINEGYNERDGFIETKKLVFNLCDMKLNIVNHRVEMQPQYITSFMYIELLEKLVKLRNTVRRQVEYYFSDINYFNDNFLLSQVDQFGYINLTLIASFNRIKQATHNITFLQHALSLPPLTNSHFNNDFTKLRKTQTFQK